MAFRDNSRVYGAAGASLIAVAVTARYVAKWRSRRSMRRGGGDREVGGGRVFIGLDLPDPTVAAPRPCDYAVLDTDLACTFGQWEYREDGAGIIPDRALGRSFILAVDGPQGLAGELGATMRESERLVNAPGHSPHDMPTGGKPFEGFIAGSVKLFHRLVTSGSRFRLLGLEGIPPTDTTLIEVYPGGAWKLIAPEQLPKKGTLEGRRARVDLLTDLGVQLPEAPLPTHDHLDAAIAAWTAYKFHLGEVSIAGRVPELDAEKGVIREGYIVQPAKPPDTPLEEDVAPV